MEKQTSFDRIIGGTDEQKEKVIQKAEEASFKTGQELFGEYLIEPTLEETKAIEESVAYANSIAKQYGASRQFDTDRIFLLKSDAVELLSNGKIRKGVCNSFDQSIGVERVESVARLASCVVHEMLHMNSYQAAQITDNRHGPYRSGISMRGRNNEGNYFGIAEEAIIAILSRKFFDQIISKDILYKEEMERTTKIKEWLLIFIEKHTPEEKKDKLRLLIEDILILPQSKEAYQELYDSDKEDVYKFGFFTGFFKNISDDIFHERNKEREKFEEVLNRIISNSEGKITDKEFLFDKFARAHFTGDYLQLSRIIEEALGKGSFRRIAMELGDMK